MDSVEKRRELYKKNYKPGSTDWQFEEMHANRAEILRTLWPKLQTMGVEIVGSVSRKQMAREYNEAECLAYSSCPCDYTETFGVAVLEGCASGAVPVLGPCDAFPELWSACPMTKEPCDKNPNAWGDLVIEGLRGGFGDVRPRLRQVAAQYDWPNLHILLEGIIEMVRARK
jgi:hypothetical protein